MKEGASYRADIDGLRAVAVVSVLLFHLHVAGFDGGYVGVDVFFVISGYLITSYIQPQILSGQFSLREFYARRVRRLGPALLMLSVPVAIAAWILLYPEALRQFATSLGFQFLALQNIVFLSEGEYFHGADTKPLLHTWSLAVEEQFYLVWPLLLMLTRRMRFRYQLGLVSLVMLMSFVLNLALFSMSPKASFFLLPTRAWEMGIGGMLALLERERAFDGWFTPGLRTVSGFLGMALVVVAIVTFSAETPFPGKAATLPVIGTALVIAAGSAGPRGWVGRALSLRGLVYLGLLSYPLYLWHWPLITFARHLRIDPVTPLHAVAILLLSTALAAVTYHFVETPIRERRWLPNTRPMLFVAGSTAAALVVTAAHLYASDGASYRFPPEARAMLTAPLYSRTERCGFWFRTMHPREQVCELISPPDAKRRILLWGNSHADMWSGMLRELGDEHDSTIFLNARNCRPTRDTEFCGAHVQEAIFSFIETQRVNDVVLAATWYGAYDIRDEVFEEQLTAVLERLSAMPIRVWLVTDIPSGPEMDPVTLFEREPAAPRFGSLPLDSFLPQKRREEKLFARYARTYHNVRIIDSSAGLCDNAACFAGRGETAYYRDRGHLTDAGARTARDQFRSVFMD